MQFLRIDRLLARHKEDARDGFPFVVGGVAQNRGGEDEERKENESRAYSIPAWRHHF
jgi:hypothetical protein